MPRRRAGLLGALGLTALLVGALTGCASTAGDAPSPTPSESVAAMDVDAAWLDGARLVGLVTQGSSSCLPTGVIGPYADGVLQVTLFNDPEAACTRDLVPQITLIELPSEVDRSQALRIIVTSDTSEGEVTLPGLEGSVDEDASEQLPSAGWTTTDGSFIVLLWGSSGCPEYITTTEVTGEAAVTASLSGIPTDKVCTADIAPNPLLTSAEGLAGAADVVLTLTGPTGTEYTTTILGAAAD